MDSEATRAPTRKVRAAWVTGPCLEREAQDLAGSTGATRDYR